MRPLLSLQFSWKYLCRTFILCMVTKWLHFWDKLRNSSCHYLGISGMYWVTFQVLAEMHVGIHVKCSLLLPNLTKSGICGYVLVKFCIRFPENIYSCTWVTCIYLNSRHEAHMCIFVYGPGMDVMSSIYWISPV
jgi:hypothetical protein